MYVQGVQLRDFHGKRRKNEDKSGTKIEFISVTGYRSVLMWKKPVSIVLLHEKKHQGTRGWKRVNVRSKKNHVSPKNLFMIDCNSNNFQGFYFSSVNYFSQSVLGKKLLLFLPNNCLAQISCDLTFQRSDTL